MKKFIWFCLTLLYLSGSFLHASPHKSRWHTTNYIWNFGLLSISDIGLDRDPRRYFANEPTFNKSNYDHIKEGDIVWIKCRFIPQFYREVLPSTHCRFSLIISDGDESFPSAISNELDVEDFISNDKIIHIFAQNNDYKGSSDKVTSIPIGMDFHTVAYKGNNGGWGVFGSPVVQEAFLNKLLATFKPTYLRKKRAFVDFQLSDSMGLGDCHRYMETGETRTSIFNYLLTTNLIDYSGFMKRSDLWKTKGEYAFSISPHGNGLDCHRTWEDLVLGCIVIVKTSSLDVLYEGLPVVIVQDWSEITEQNLDSWLHKYADAFTNPDFRTKLTNDYWIHKILDTLQGK